MELKAKDMEFHQVLDSIHRERERKEEELRAITNTVVAERNDGQGGDVELKNKNLVKSMRARINQLVRELGSNRKEVDSLKSFMEERRLGFEKKERELELMKKQFEGRVRELDSKEKHFQSRLRHFEGQVQHGEQIEVRAKKLEAKEKQIEGQVKDLEVKKKQCEGMMKELDVKEADIEVKQKELDSKEKQFEGQMKDLESKMKQFEGKAEELELKEARFKGQVKELESKEKQFDEQVKDIESKVKQFEGQVKELKSKQKEFEVVVLVHESKEKQFKGKVREFDSREKHYEGRVRVLESNEKQYERRVRVLESNEKQFERRARELEYNEKQYERRVKELESNKKRYEGRLKELESNEKQYEGRMRELKSKEKQFESKVKELESKEKQIEGRVKELESNEKQYERRVTELEDLSNILLLHQAKTEQQHFTDANSANNTKNVQLLFSLLDKYELMCSQVSDALQTSADPTKLVLDTIKGCYTPHSRQEFIEYDAIISRRTCNLLMDELKKSLPAIDNRSSPTLDGRNLLLPYIEHTNEPELIGSDILVNLQTSSDPAKLVLDIIQNPIVPQNIGNEGVIIDGSHIFLLEQLMIISPPVKPHVREEALKLALDLKANMRESAENSLMILGFLLLLSNYGLASDFNEDEVLKLLELAAQHKQTVELFRTLGFVDKIYDFVQNLVKMQQLIEAVRFICAYELADKIQPVDLLRQHMARVKTITKRFVGKKRSIEKKVKARDREIATLGNVLQCISDNNLGSQDLVNEIQDRIVELERQKENMVRLASKAVSKVEERLPEERERGIEHSNATVIMNQDKVQEPEKINPAQASVSRNPAKVQQPEVKTCAGEAVTPNQVQMQKCEEKKRAIGAVSKNQDKVQQSKKKKGANDTFIKNQVKVQHPEEKKPSDGAVILKDDKVQQAEEKVCANANESISVNQVAVQKPEEKKRANEVLSNDNNQQWGNINKRPRTAITQSQPSVFTPRPYQHVFMPMPLHFGLPPNYYGVPNPNHMGVGRYGNRATNYFGNSRPYPPFS
uniref:Involucrin n=1 Tax=Cajanus cajan TaxID=3821 RepID=A0A151TM86_CAJCA|nr:Involucrin [Cajanus cajan]